YTSGPSEAEEGEEGMDRSIVSTAHLAGAAPLTGRSAPASATESDNSGRPELRPGQLVPDLTLRRAARDGALRIRDGRGPRAIVALHSLECSDCRAYAERLARHSGDAAAEQGGRFLIVLPGTAQDGAAAGLDAAGVPVLEDPD